MKLKFVNLKKLRNILQSSKQEWYFQFGLMNITKVSAASTESTINQRNHHKYLAAEKTNCDSNRKY